VAQDHNSVIQFYKKKNGDISKDIEECYGVRRTVEQDK